MIYVDDGEEIGFEGPIDIPDDKTFVVMNVSLLDDKPVSFSAIYRNDDGSFTYKEYKLKN